MVDQGWYSVPAALAMLGSSPDRVAAAAGIDVEALENAVSDGPALSPSDFRRLRSYLWRYGLLLVALPGAEGVVRLAPVAELTAWKRYAEQYPDGSPYGWGFKIFAKIWRAWLKLRGRYHPIGRTRGPTDGAGEARDTVVNIRDGGAS